jgi:outer membrane protein assembly factor BamB
MVEFGDFDSGFADFETELEEFELVKTRKMDRHLKSSGGGGILAGPVLHKGVIYFASADSYVYAVNADTGKEEWRFRTHGELWSTPVVSDNMLWVGSYDKNLYCLNLHGKEVWRFPTGGKIASSPFVYKNLVLAGSNDGYLYALDRRAGKEIWKFRTGDLIASSPIVWDGKIYIGSYDCNMYCLNVEGNEVWRFRTGAEIWSLQASSSVYDGVLYFASMDGYVYALDAETGKEVWRVMTGKYGNCMQPAVNENLVLQPSRDGILFAFDKKGRELWRFNLGNLPSSVVIHEDTIFIGSESGTLHALTLGGEEKWRFETGGKLFGAVVIWKDMVYLPSFDCHLYCLNAEGEEKWRFATSDVNVTKLAPPHDAFELKVKKGMVIEDAAEEGRYKKKKGEEAVSLSDYHVASEYSTTSEYRHKSDYDTSFVMFEDALEGEEIWTFHSKDSNLLISRRN